MSEAKVDVIDQPNPAYAHGRFTRSHTEAEARLMSGQSLAEERRVLEQEYWRRGQDARLRHAYEKQSRWVLLREVKAPLVLVGLKISPQSNHVLWKERQVRLADTPLRVLIALARAHPRPLKGQQILTMVWGNVGYDLDCVRTEVCLLRHRLPGLVGSTPNPTGVIGAPRVPCLYAAYWLNLPGRPPPEEV